ncbi:hypothetical protein COL30_26440 [Bacillus pseudomycoides]|uniref:ABC-2 type transporter transmembrane domain-containing protein n=1 Tax=Bacillus pseudomycoides TaxID=64104 RepID=A0A2C4F0C0_9BACI|nr:hypothetical protein CON99_27865 [Bacillus pseudomycoides]PED06086.1 hypothetical protein COO19_22945 [Bacillus pseudomycoides]PED70152.1 hypothetical protein CON97_21105 [Bacillus pseudomycoides]PEI46967.1 hypothetical protein CN620_00565 [Bacillus pseudomycoides]PEI90867.1 hypothetical protein CN686_23415 [Bacillus pseudomycoides]
MLLLYVLAITWIAITFGLIAKTQEGAGSFSFILMFLLFISSAFAPTETMPKAVQILADYQSMTPIIESVCSLLMENHRGVTH